MGNLLSVGNIEEGWVYIYEAWITFRRGEEYRDEVVYIY